MENPETTPTNPVPNQSPQSAVTNSEFQQTVAPSSVNFATANTTATPSLTRMANTTTAMDFGTPVKKKSKMPLVFVGCLLFICIGFLALAGGVFAAYQSNTNIPVLSDLIEQVELATFSDEQLSNSLVQETLNQLDNLAEGNQTLSLAEYFSNNFKFDYFINGEFVTKENGLETMDLTGNGFSSNNSNMIDLEVNSDLDVKVSDITINPSLDIKIKANEAKQDVYIKLDKIPSDLILGIKIPNDWVKIDVNEVIEDGLISDLDSSTNEDSMDIFNNKETVDSIRQIISSETFKKGISRAPDQIINNIRTNCIQMSYTLSDIAEMTDSKEIRELTENVNNADFTVELCTGRKDLKLYKATIKLNGDVAEGKLKVSGELNFSDFDKVNTVSEPNNFITLDEFFGPLDVGQSSPNFNVELDASDYSRLEELDALNSLDNSYFNDLESLYKL